MKDSKHVLCHTHGNNAAKICKEKPRWENTRDLNYCDEGIFLFLLMMDIDFNLMTGLAFITML